MPQSTIGLHHRSKRKRIYQKYEDYPHPNKVKRFVDVVVYIMGIIVPILTIPQAAQIWLNKTAEGVSSITWIAYLISAVIWTIYGILHKEKPVIITFSLMTIINIVIVMGIFIFG